jgi:hypothetical protein
VPNAVDVRASQCCYCQYSATAASSWVVIAVATTSLQQCTSTTVLLSTLHTALADTVFINVPPPGPQCAQQPVAASTTAAASDATAAAMNDYICALALNALLVVHEQLSFSTESKASAAATTATTAGAGTGSTTGTKMEIQSSSKATWAHTAQQEQLSLLHSRVLVVLPDSSSSDDDSPCSAEQLVAVAVPAATGVWIVQSGAIVSSVLNIVLPTAEEQQHLDTPAVTAYCVDGVVCAVRLSTAAVEQALLLAQADEFSQCYTAYDRGATAATATAEQTASTGLEALVQRLVAASSTNVSMQARTVEVTTDTAVQHTSSLSAAVTTAALARAQALHNERFAILQHELAALDAAAAAAPPNRWSQSLAAIACRLQSAAVDASVSLTNSNDSSSSSSSSSVGKALGPGQHCEWRRAMAGAKLCDDTAGKLLVVHMFYHSDVQSYQHRVHSRTATALTLMHVHTSTSASMYVAQSWYNKVYTHSLTTN